MNILCEISGGYDSALAVLKAKEKYKGGKFFGIMVNYGQAPFEKEFELAKKFCVKEGLELKVVEIKNLFHTGTVIGESSSEEKISNIYTPLRNLVILSCASSYAEFIKAEVIIVGSKGLNIDLGKHSFKDSVLPFYVLVEGVLKYASYENICIDPILTNNRNIKMSKKEVIEDLISYGYSLHDFWNCFNSNDVMCGYCNNCLERKEIEKEILHA
jgi:7-cyano-7-deazaguanine synthase